MVVWEVHRYGVHKQLPTFIITEKDTMKLLSKFVTIAMMGMMPAAMMYSQSTGSLTQTVNKRNTIGALSASPTTGIDVGTTVNFSYQLSTGGAPSPASETVQFFDGATALGSPVAITQGTGSNLLPFAQISTANGWTNVGTAPTITPNAAIITGPDGSVGLTTTLLLPASGSGVSFAVGGATSYAGQPMTYSIYVNGPAGNTVNLNITDNPHSAVSQTTPCTLTGTWTRCQVNASFPSGANPGFVVTFTSSTATAQTISVDDSQVEEAATAGPFVSTIGTALTAAQSGAATFSFAGFTDGSHNITVQYPGDANFVGSTSNAIMFTDGKGTATAGVTASPASPSVFGTAVTLTASVTGDPTTVPTGTVTFMDGTTVLGTGTLSNGAAALTLSGATSLTAGTHSITIVYSGDTNYNPVTSAVLTYVVTPAPASTSVTTTLTSSLNPSIYGDMVTLTVNVASTIGVTPTGTVTIKDAFNNSTLGVVTLTNGTGTLVVNPIFMAGSHTITATYSGDSNFSGSN